MRGAAIRNIPEGHGTRSYKIARVFVGAWDAMGKGGGAGAAMCNGSRIRGSGVMELQDEIRPIAGPGSGEEICRGRERVWEVHEERERVCV